MTTTLDNLKAVVSNQNFVILDTETTGLQRGEICQIAIVDGSGEILLDTLVKPVGSIPLDATRIHGITDDDVKDAPAFQDIAHKIALLLRGRDVIVYNAIYDRKMLHQSAEAAGMEKIDWKTFSTWHCAMEAFAEFYGEWNSYHQSYRWKSLSVAAAYCNIPVNGAHNALCDCIMTLAVTLWITSHPAG